jgi:DNA-binding response OmpR family regulator
MDTQLKIALVEDNDDLRDLLMRDLIGAKYAVLAASCAEELDQLSAENLFKLLVLDLNLPGESGIDIARRYKQSNPNIYIIMLTARTQLEEKVEGYSAGADVYLTKPISSEELLAAIGSISRRLNDKKSNWEAVLNLRDLVLSSNQSVSLNRHEAIILKSLCESENHQLPYFRLIENFGEEVTETSKATLEVRVVRLRKKMEEIGLARKAIRALRSEGYQLLCQIQVVS